MPAGLLGPWFWVLFGTFWTFPHQGLRWLLLGSSQSLAEYSSNTSSPEWWLWLEAELQVAFTSPRTRQMRRYRELNNFPNHGGNKCEGGNIKSRLANCLLSKLSLSLFSDNSSHFAPFSFCQPQVGRKLLFKPLPFLTFVGAKVPNSYQVWLI